jgi:hypothetical protein
MVPARSIVAIDSSPYGMPLMGMSAARNPVTAVASHLQPLRCKRATKLLLRTILNAPESPRRIREF